MNAEIDYLLTVTAEGITTYEGDDAYLIQISEWLDTPEGTVWGAPHWGNNLSQYRHLPQSDLTSRAIENAIVLKVTTDLPNLTVSAIRVVPIESDLYRIIIQLSQSQNTLIKDKAL